MLGPEGVNDLRAAPLVGFALLGRQVQRVEVFRHEGFGCELTVFSELCLVNPAALVAARAGCDVERLDERFDLGLDMIEELANHGRVAAGQLVLRNEPSDGVKIHPGHLKAKTGTLHQRRAAAHEWVQYAKLLERAGLLVVGVVMIPDSLRCFVVLLGCLRGCGDEQAPKNAGPPAGPPLGHLVDRLAGVALQVAQGIDGLDGKVHFQARQRPVGIIEIRNGQPHRLAQVRRLMAVSVCAIRTVFLAAAFGGLDVFRHAGKYSFFAHQLLRVYQRGGSSTKGTAISSSVKPP